MERVKLADKRTENTVKKTQRLGPHIGDCVQLTLQEAAAVKCNVVYITISMSVYSQRHHDALQARIAARAEQHVSPHKLPICSLLAQKHPTTSQSSNFNSPAANMQPSWSPDNGR